MSRAAADRALVNAPELAPYLRAAREGRFVLPRCRTCSHLQWPPRPRCRRCHGDGFESVEVPLSGRVYSWTTTHSGPTPALTKVAPYTVVIVTLSQPDEIRVVGRWEPADAAPGLRLDDPVSGRVTIGDDGLPVLTWRHRD